MHWPKVLFFLLRRAVLRTTGALAYPTIADKLGAEGLHDAIWEEGHLLFFLMMGVGASFLIDLFIIATAPEASEYENSCDSDESGLD